MVSFKHLTLEDIEWRPLGTHGLRCKTLAGDEETGAMLNFLDIPKGWRGGGVAHYHHAFEEVLILEGSVTLGAGRYFVKDDYFYRPSMVVHGHDEQSDEGCIALVRSDGPLALNLVHEPAEADEYPLEQVDPRGHVLQLPVDQVEWQKADGFPPEWDIRPLSRDPSTGAQTVMARIPSAWSGETAIAHEADYAAFLLDGDLTADGDTYAAKHFVRGPAGSGPTGPASSDAGATLLFWFGPKH